MATGEIGMGGRERKFLKLAPARLQRKRKGLEQEREYH